jgi:hypothetical protein
VQAPPVLDILGSPPQNIAKLGNIPFVRANNPKFMTPSQPSQSSPEKINREPCRHPQVQIVSRDEETEYVECRECGEVFESSELKDMAIEEEKQLDEE